MCYFLRIFSQTADSFLPSQLAEAVDCSVSITAMFESEWRELTFRISDDAEIILVERSSVTESEDCRDELSEIISELEKDLTPSKTWVIDYLKKTCVLYTIEVSSLQGLRTAARIQTEIWLKVNGLLQSDLEGFRDELGYLIVATGNNMQGVQRVAVLQDERWVRFSIDMANEVQVGSFFAGKVPVGTGIHAVG